MKNKIFFAPGLKLDFDERPDETMVRCYGQITAVSCDIFEREIQDNLIPESRGKLVAVNTRIVLDFSKVCYVDRAGLKAILALWMAGQNRCCDVEIINFRNRTRKLLYITRLDPILTYVKSLFHSGKPVPTGTPGWRAAEENGSDNKALGV